MFDQKKTGKNEFSEVALEVALVIDRINADLSSASDTTSAAVLSPNRDIAFMGDTKGGPFDIPGTLARQWLALLVPFYFAEALVRALTESGRHAVVAALAATLAAMTFFALLAWFRAEKR